ncbi:hypothetical protein PIIN_05096 [Serendipita indica DSM 11827]|uniref:Uncharacterized protein n=1 Tax=Serendipita indica (strain DSM 11827) TaxID=1109443 RepID=G4TIL7_SERID|nr:hypothetical protein PIIN_05096 [Serendipita indica DSM 11827]
MRLECRLPAELWQNVLRYAIYVPIFFEIDPAEAYGLPGLQRYCDPGGYWAAERTRNILMRICRAWVLYLRHFPHRYVELADVLHDRVPAEALAVAHRILWKVPHCKCDFSWSKYEDGCDKLSFLSNVGVWRVEILEIEGRRWSNLLDTLTAGN